MRAGHGIAELGRWRFCLVAAAMLVACAPASAHHQSLQSGPIVGVAIAAITHGEMQIVAKYRGRILELAEREPRTDPTLRRLAGFVSLQHFACFWDLIPGSLADEDSPFNECAHADIAGVRELLAHLITMPGDQSEAKTLEARIETDLASDPAASQLCSSSREVFDSGIIIWPDWQLAPSHLPTVLTFCVMLILAAAGISRLALSSSRNRATLAKRIEQTDDFANNNKPDQPRHV